MQEFQMVDEARFHPNACVFCGSVTPPFVDTLCETDEPMGRRLYVCSNICGPFIARALGWTSPEIAEELDAAIDSALGRVADLEEQVEAAKELATLNLSSEETDLVRAFRQSQRSGTTTNGKGASEQEWAQRTFSSEPRVQKDGTVVPCSATKKDGNPCTASRLPGRDVCVAHVKQRAAA